MPLFKIEGEDIVIIPPASPINAEFLVNKFTEEIKIVLERLSKVKSFKNSQPLYHKRMILRKKIQYYKNYFPEGELKCIQI